MQYRLKQRVVHPVHGPGEIIAKDEAKRTVTIRFDNDKELPLIYSEAFLVLTPTKDF
jgi:RNA polymerase-interacting CarD/CdnL/TRCF family regulator